MFFFGIVLKLHCFNLHLCLIFYKYIASLESSQAKIKNQINSLLHARASCRIEQKKETFLDHLSIEAIAMVRYTIYAAVNRLYKRLTTA